MCGMQPKLIINIMICQRGAEGQTQGEDKQDLLQSYQGWGTEIETTQAFKNQPKLIHSGNNDPFHVWYVVIIFWFMLFLHGATNMMSYLLSTAATTLVATWGRQRAT